MRMLLSFVFLLTLAALTGYLAKRRGRDPVGWFLISLLVGAFALLILFILPDKAEENGSELETDEDRLLTGTQGAMEASVFAKDWYYLDKLHTQQGPVSFEQMQRANQEGIIEGSTYVWSEGMPRWFRVEELPALKEALLHSDLLVFQK